MKQTKKAGNKPAPKPKLVKKAKPSAEQELDMFIAELPNKTKRYLYWGMAISNLKRWLKTFF